MLIATVRAGNVIGGGDWAEDRLLPDLMRAAFSGEPARIRNPRLDPAVAACARRRSPAISTIGARLLAGDQAAAEAWNLGPERPTPASASQDLIDAVRRAVPQLAGRRPAGRQRPA